MIGAAVLPIVSCREKVEDKKMNILFIMCDDHSYQTISAYDNRFISTPNIDRIAAVIWENLNEENKISLFVRMIDPKVHSFTTRIINKNK